MTYEITRDVNSLKPYFIKFLVNPINKYANIKLTINGVNNPPKIYKTNKKANGNQIEPIENQLNRKPKKPTKLGLTLVSNP